MARVLITGGAGYVGSHAAKALAGVGHDCTVFDSLRTGRREFVKWGHFRHGDIRDRAVLAAVLAEGRFEAVMHFAALAYVGESVGQPLDYYDVNVSGTRVLLEEMMRADVPTLVFSSSCAVYGTPAQVPIGEATETRPVNPYGMTKLICERMMDDVEAAHGLKSVRLRYFNAAGADPDGEIGEHHEPETHLVPVALNVALGRQPHIQLFGRDYDTPDGSAVRDFVHVTDLAAAHVRALEYLLAGGASRSLNLGTGRGVSVREVIEAARTVTGRPIATEWAPRRTGDPGLLIADSAAARQVLKWAPTRSELTLMVGDAWRWHVSRFGR